MITNGKGRAVNEYMKSLFLLRHAKSSWSDPDLADFDRPLNPRGLDAAPFMGSVMAEKGYNPSIILSSPAERARHTAHLTKGSGGLDAEILYDDRIYEASPHALRQVISELSDVHDSALIVGHNPGMEGLIRYLSSEIEAMPTAALAIIELDLDSWRAVTDSCGRVKAIYRPKDEMPRSDAVGQ